MDEKKQVLKVDMGAEGTRIIKASFPSNSHKDKEEAQNQKEKPKKLQKVVTGVVVKKKKTLGEKFMATFISDDVANVKSYIIHGVLVPAAKDTVTDIVQGVMDALRNGLDIALFGEVRNSRSRRDSGRTYVSYDRYSSRDRDDRRDRDRRDRDRRDDKKDDRRDDSSRNRRSHRFEDIVFETKGDAVDVRDTLINTIEQYGQATVANFYDLVGITEEYTDHDYGWTNLASSSISMVRGGGWVVNLPKPILLD